MSKWLKPSELPEFSGYVWASRKLQPWDKKIHGPTLYQVSNTYHKGKIEFWSPDSMTWLPMQDDHFWVIPAEVPAPIIDWDNPNEVK